MRKLLSLPLALAFALFTSPAMAAMVDIPSQGFQWPAYPVSTGTLEDGCCGQNLLNLNASNLKTSICGRVYQNDLTFRNGSATKDIHSIGFNVGTKSGTWTLQVSVQAASTSAGPPIQPTGTVLSGGNALATMANGTVTSASFNTTPALTADVTGVHYGDLICVVFEYSAYTSGGVPITGILSTDPMPWGAAVTNWNGASWAAAAAAGGNTAVPTIQLNFADGTVGGFAFTMPTANAASFTDIVNLTSTPREVGMEFQTPFDAQINALCMTTSTSNTSSNWTLEITDKAITPNVLASVNGLGSQSRANGGFQGLGCYPINRVTVTRNTSYVVGLLGTSAAGNNAQVFWMGIPASASLDANFGCGRKCGRVTRSAGGTWSAIDNTKLPLMPVVITAIDNNTGP